MLTDFAHSDRQRLIHPGILDALREFFTQEPDIGMPPRIDRPHASTTDYLMTAKRDDAIRKLGRMWRGRADCEHRYTNSRGVLTRPDALTERTT